MHTSKTSIAWFRDDLRVRDNPALRAATTDGAAVALFVLDEETPGIRQLGGAARWWLHHSLEALREELDAIGVPLLLRRGAAMSVVPEVARDLDARAVYWNRRYGQPERNIDAALKSWAADSGLHAESFQASLLHEPWKVRTSQAEQYKVYTPFWKAVSALDIRRPLDPPEPGLGFEGNLPKGERLEEWLLLPSVPDWSTGLAETWRPSTQQAQEFLDDFTHHHLGRYAEDRDRPDLPGSSRLSPFLRWGQLSPFQVWHAQSRLRRQHPEGSRAFASELGWREFCWHQYYHHADLATTNLRPQFNHFPWEQPRQGSNSPAGRLLTAWQRGRTGVPIVDAGQRQLWQTGWMHNRVRMVSASLLVKNFGIDWRLGEQWFWDTLVDADPASNPANWQWVAGSGADAAPFFRIFNPQTQSRKFDPHGRYARQWIPELDTPDYPDPVVDLKASRQEALDAYREIK